VAWRHGAAAARPSVNYCGCHLEAVNVRFNADGYQKWLEKLMAAEAVAIAPVK